MQDTKKHNKVMMIGQTTVYHHGRDGEHGAEVELELEKSRGERKIL